MRKITILLIALICMSCKTRLATNYKIVTAKRKYYTNKISYVNDSILFCETNRKGLPKVPYTLPYKDCEIISAN